LSEDNALIFQIQAGGNSNPHNPVERGVTKINALSLMACESSGEKPPLFMISRMHEAVLTVAALLRTRVLTCQISIGCLRRLWIRQNPVT
jgi:hypothetical protein